MSLLILGITGSCIGASVIMSNFFGAGEYEKIKEELGTSMILGGIVSAVVLIAGLTGSEKILRMMQVPEEIFADALIYLRIIFVGMIFTCLYNIYASALRSIGDAKTPIRFLAISSGLNALLDFIFIAIFRMGVVGAGLATDIAEAVSVLLCVIYVYQKKPMLHITRKHFVWNKELIRKTIALGGTSALQQCSQPVGKLFIQGMINTLGVNTIAAFNAVGKIEDFALVPERSISNAMMTFTAQNDGAKQEERIKRGLFSGLSLEVGYWILICIVILIFKKPLLRLFSTGELTLSEGNRYFTIMAFFYILPGLTNGMQGFFRGIGRMKVTLAGTLIQITVRVIFTWILIGSLGITGVAYACMAGWVAMLCMEFPYATHIMKKRSKKRKDAL